MQVKKSLQAKQKGIELSQRTKQIREIKKHEKKIQKTFAVQKKKEKNQFLYNIKRYIMVSYLYSK